MPSIAQSTGPLEQATVHLGLGCSFYTGAAVEGVGIPNFFHGKNLTHFKTIDGTTRKCRGQRKMWLTETGASGDGNQQSH